MTKCFKLVLKNNNRICSLNEPIFSLREDRRKMQHFSLINARKMGNFAVECRSTDVAEMPYNAEKVNLVINIYFFTFKRENK